MVSIRSMMRVLTLAGALAGLAMAPLGVSANDNPKPTLAKGKGDKCVEETSFMRRNHMDLLKHQRNLTMREGIRMPKHSLKGCVECHASEKTGSVAASKEDFCAHCHTYAAVKLDCWDCHATRPKGKSAKPEAGMSVMSTVHPGGHSQ